MKDRFERLYEISGNLYVSQAPIIITGGVLLKDTVSDSVIIQLKFQSISEKVIKALKINITALDVTNQILPDSIEYQYLDLNIRTGQEFGSSKAIVVPSIVTRSFNIDKVTVIFEGNEQWESESELCIISKMQSLESTLKNKEMIKQYQLTTNKKAICKPIETMGIWQCSCSTWNNKETCSLCGLKKERVFSAYDLNVLKETMTIRIAKEEEEARKAREIQEAEDKKRRKRNKILLVIFSIACLILGIITAVILTKPTRVIAKAEKQIEAGEYVDAVNTLESLKQPEKTQALYDEVIELMDNEVNGAIDNKDLKTAIKLLKEYTMIPSYNSYITTVQELCPHENISTNTKDATCTEDGYIRKTCELCEKLDETILQATGHNNTVDVKKQPTCTEEGLQTLTCSVCGNISDEKMNALGHSYQKKITKNPTCEVDGACINTCSVCAESYSEVVAKTGHNWKKATCTVAGKCTTCGKAGESATGHSWNKVVDKEVICNGCSIGYPVNVKINTSGALGNQISPNVDVNSISITHQESYYTPNGEIYSLATVRVTGTSHTNYATLVIDFEDGTNDGWFETFEFPLFKQGSFTYETTVLFAHIDSTYSVDIVGW